MQYVSILQAVPTAIQFRCSVTSFHRAHHAGVEWGMNYCPVSHFDSSVQFHTTVEREKTPSFVPSVIHPNLPRVVQAKHFATRSKIGPFVVDAET